MATSFPDDYEASPLKPELLQRQPDAEALSGPWDQVCMPCAYRAELRLNSGFKATIEQHKKDIYESIYPPEANAKASTKPMDTSLEDEHAPDMDEL